MAGLLPVDPNSPMPYPPQTCRSLSAAYEMVVGPHFSNPSPDSPSSLSPSQSPLAPSSSLDCDHMSIMGVCNPFPHPYMHSTTASGLFPCQSVISQSPHLFPLHLGGRVCPSTPLWRVEGRTAAPAVPVGGLPTPLGWSGAPCQAIAGNPCQSPHPSGIQAWDSPQSPLSPVLPLGMHVRMLFSGSPYGSRLGGCA